MVILAVDIGTGTQDILLFDSEREVENCFKMVLPSPTVQLAQAVREATRRGEDVVLTGVLMGGGPCAWAVRDHLEAGYRVYATPEAARTFDDDLAVVTSMGVTLVSEDEAAAIHDQAVHLRTGDFHYRAITQAFRPFGIDLDRDLDALAVAVFDHGQAPPGVSDRLFRFQYLAERVQAENRLSAFAFCAEDVPPILTRMRAVAASIPRDDLPVVLMDTAPAAVLGALQDPAIGQRRSVIVVNVGNFHCLAFRLGNEGIEGLFEHHTGEINAVQLGIFLERLAEGTLTHEEVFDTQGHGALLFHKRVIPPEERFWVVTGPRRNLLRAIPHPKLFAAPFGDMMLTGCYGLIRACGEVMPEYAPLIEGALKGGDGRTLW
ncbi:MAG: DUF1786 domain-containing protein [Anaerolineae bacterium]|nr:DUF1786 domain-containing protein [Anaerolineae bacterium]MDW8069965.1 DUF1786 domain-containing protein [Anaerolineae bacterium]